MKKLKVYLMLFALSFSMASCDMDKVMKIADFGMSLYERYSTTRGELPQIHKIKNAEFSTTRGETATFLNGIKDLNYITYPGVDASFREQIVNDLKSKIDESKVKHEVCTETQCVMSFEDKGLLIFNQKGDDLEAMVMKGKFDSAEVDRVIKSGFIFKIKELIKRN